MLKLPERFPVRHIQTDLSNWEPLFVTITYFKYPNSYPIMVMPGNVVIVEAEMSVSAVVVGPKVDSSTLSSVRPCADGTSDPSTRQEQQQEVLGVADPLLMHCIESRKASTDLSCEFMRAPGR